MRPSIRITLALIFFCLAALNGFANGKSIQPWASVSLVSGQILKIDSFLSTHISVVSVQPVSEDAVDAEKAGDKICSCQILTMKSSNYQHFYVVLLAEKTNDGTTAAYDIAKNKLQKEKKHLKNLFYDDIRVISEKQGVGSCRKMYAQLKRSDKYLKMYEILNADTF